MMKIGCAIFGETAETPVGSFDTMVGTDLMVAMTSMVVYPCTFDSDSQDEQAHSSDESNDCQWLHFECEIGME